MKNVSRHRPVYLANGNLFRTTAGFIVYIAKQTHQYNKEHTYGSYKYRILEAIDTPSTYLTYLFERSKLVLVRRPQLRIESFQFFQVFLIRLLETHIHIVHPKHITMTDKGRTFHFACKAHIAYILHHTYNNAGILALIQSGTTLPHNRLRYLQLFHGSFANQYIAFFFRPISFYQLHAHQLRIFLFHPHIMSSKTGSIVVRKNTIGSA